MSGYIETGYIAVVGVLAVYGVTLSRRERSTRLRLRRLGVIPPARPAKSSKVAENAGTPSGEQPTS